MMEPSTQQSSPRRAGRLQHRAQHHAYHGNPLHRRPPTTIPKADYLDLTSDDIATETLSFATQADLDPYITNLESDMREAAKTFEFERAAKLRVTIRDLRAKELLFS
jgi:excinuclease UvrABC helicase subunit UvrB